MFATKIMTATLALSSMLVAQAPGLEEALPAVEGLRTGPLRAASIDVYIEQPGGQPVGHPAPSPATLRPRLVGGGAPQASTQTSGVAINQGFVEYTEHGPAYEADDGDPVSSAPAGSGPRQVVEDHESYQFSQAGGVSTAGPSGSDLAGAAGFRSTGVGGLEDEPLALQPGASVTRCGVTVSNLEASASAVLLSPAGAGCFTGIRVGDGVHASIDTAADATGLEALQVTVMGRAWLDVSGERGLGQYDPREFASTPAGILVDGDGLSASDQADLATITLKSSRNVVETLGASSGHQIHVEGASNLIRLHGGDQVLSDGLDVRVLWMPPVFLQ